MNLFVCFFRLGTKNEKTYYPTHIRYSTWLIGVIAGYILFKYRSRTIRIPKVIQYLPFHSINHSSNADENCFLQILNLLAWILSIGVMLAVIFVNYPLVQSDTTSTPLDYALYDALGRILWSIALCYIVFACVHDSGGPVNWFLSYPLWQPISRVCYAIYLIHFSVLLTLVASMKAPPYLNELMAFHAFIGSYILTVFISFIASLAFESPIVIIEKLIFNRK